MIAKQAVDSWLEKKRLALIKSYEDEGLKASGRWGRSLETSSELKGTRLTASIYGERYTGALIGGRAKTGSGGGGSGKTLQQLIRTWIDDKGIVPTTGTKDSLSWAISTKIHKEGIRVPNRYNSGQFINRVFTKDAINELINEVGKAFGNVVKTEILTAARK
jgi:hypothetical protein